MFKSLHHRAGHYAVITAICSFTCFANLGGASLWDVDEGRNVTCSFEMVESGEYIVPTFNSQLRAHKPVLLYWLQALAFKLFGYNEFASRLPSALAALLAVILAYELGRSMFDKTSGLWAGCIAATTPLIIGAARFANPDSLLNTSNVLIMTIFWMGWRWPASWWFAALGAAVGLAFLAKGPVGLVLPFAVGLAYLVWQGEWRRLLQLRMFWSVLTFCVVAGPWFFWVAIKTKSEFLRTFFLQHNVDRFLQPMENHSGSAAYYLMVLIVGAFPWSCWFGLTFWCACWSLVKNPWTRFRSTWEQAADRAVPVQPFTGADAAAGQVKDDAAPYRLLTLWVAAYLLFFSLAATKLPNYILPVAIPCAILTGRFLERWRLGLVRIGSGWIISNFIGLAVGGVATALGLLAVSGALPGVNLRREFPALAIWAWIGLVPMAGCGAAWWLWRRGDRRGVIFALIASGVTFLGPAAAWVSAAFNAFKAPSPLVAEAGALRLDEEVFIVGWQLEHLASLHFYVQRNIQHCQSDDEVRRSLLKPQRVYLFLPARAWQDVEEKLGVAGHVIARHADFLSNQELVVVTNMRPGRP